MGDRKLIGRTGLRIGVGAAVLLLAVAGLVANQWFAARTERSIVQAFNREQLLMARQARQLIERELGLLEQEVRALAGRLAAGPAGADPDAPPDAAALAEGLRRLRREGAVRAAVVDPARGTAHLLSGLGGGLQAVPAAGLADLLPRAAPRPGEVSLGAPVLAGGTSLLPVTAGLGPGGRLLLVEVDVGWLVAPYLEPIRSGETGYAWLIDGRGRFLYHPDAAFVGQDAFAVRGRRYPGVSYERINRLQREEMLRGREGLGSYTSGRHRGVSGEIEKLIAYTPVRPDGEDGPLWSIAVVAPLSDLQSALGTGRRAQLVLGLIVLGLVVLAALSIVAAEVRWAEVLERRVAARTAELRQSEERYRSLIENSEDAIFTLDPELRIDSCNPTTARLLGAAADGIAGREYGQFLPPAAAEEQRQLARRVLGTGRSVRGEFGRPSPEGGTWFDAGYMPLRDERGRVARVLCIARDVTERRRLQQNLASTEKLAAMGTLAAGFAHEVNNPLGVMLGFAELLRDRFAPGSPEREDAEVIQRQGLACKRIVDNLLTFARHEADTVEHSDLNRSLAQVVQVVRHNLEMRGIELELDLGAGIPPVRGDARQLEQVFLNLVTNAIAAMPQGGRLRLRTGYERRAREAVAAFTDSGLGIPPENLARIFEPFFTTKPPGEGTGLGLFVSYGIVGRYGGRIECESRPEADGRPGETTFTVRMRAQAQPGPDYEAPRPGVRD